MEHTRTVIAEILRAEGFSNRSEIVADVIANALYASEARELDALDPGLYLTPGQEIRRDALKIAGDLFVGGQVDGGDDEVLAVAKKFADFITTT